MERCSTTRLWWACWWQRRDPGTWWLAAGRELSTMRLQLGWRAAGIFVLGSWMGTWGTWVLEVLGYLKYLGTWGTCGFLRHLRYLVNSGNWGTWGTRGIWVLEVEAGVEMGRVERMQEKLFNENFSFSLNVEAGVSRECTSTPTFPLWSLGCGRITSLCRWYEYDSQKGWLWLTIWFDESCPFEYSSDLNIMKYWLSDDYHFWHLEDQFIISWFRVKLPALLMLATLRLDGHLGWFVISALLKHP